MGFLQHGDENTELWLGNENVHQMVQSYASETCRLRMENYAFNLTNCSFVSVDFKLENESDNYRIQLGQTTAFNAHVTDWTHLRDFPFKTTDHTLGDNYCFPYYSGGRWYRACHDMYFTGKYYSKSAPTYETIYVGHFKGSNSLKGCAMLFRPMNDTRPCDNPCKNGGTCEYWPRTHCGASCEEYSKCQNNGTCLYNSMSTRMSCKCVAGFTGGTCSDIATKPATATAITITAATPTSDERVLASSQPLPFSIGLLLVLFFITGLVALPFLKHKK